MNHHPDKPLQFEDQPPPVTYHSPRAPEEDDLPTPAFIAETFDSARTMALSANPPPDVTKALSALWQLIAILPEADRRQARDAAILGAANPALTDPPHLGPPDPLDPAPHMKAQAYRRNLTLLFHESPKTVQPGPRDPQTGTLLWHRVAAAMSAAETHMDNYAAQAVQNPSDDHEPTVRWSHTPGEQHAALRQISSYYTDPGAVIAHSARITRGQDPGTFRTLQHLGATDDDGEVGMLYHTAVNARFQAETDHRTVSAILAPFQAHPAQQIPALSWQSATFALARIDYAMGLETHALDAAAKAINAAAAIPSQAPEPVNSPSLLTRLRRLFRP